MCGLGDIRPARFFGHEEDVLFHVTVAVLLVAIALCDKLLVSFVESIREIFQEDETQYDVFVLGGVKVTAQHVRRVPQLFFKADVSGVLCILLSPWHGFSSYSSLRCLLPSR